MTKEQYKEYLKAVDIVCMDCWYGNPLVCDKCPVRKTCDKLAEKMQKDA